MRSRGSPIGETARAEAMAESASARDPHERAEAFPSREAEGTVWSRKARPFPAPPRRHCPRGPRASSPVRSGFCREAKDYTLRTSDSEKRTPGAGHAVRASTRLLLESRLGSSGDTALESVKRQRRNHSLAS